MIKRKTRIGIIVGIIILIVIIGIVIITKLYVGRKPNESEILAYATKQVQSQNLNPEDMKIISTNLKNDNMYVANIEFKVKSEGYNSNYKDAVVYQEIGGQWKPLKIETLSNNEIPTKGLTEEQATNLLTQQQMGGENINATGLKLTNPSIKLENGTQSYNIEYNYEEKGEYNGNITAIANFTFKNGEWIFEKFTNESGKFNIEPLEKNTMIQLFVDYEKESGNATIAYENTTVTTDTCSIISTTGDGSNGTMNAIIGITASNGPSSGSQLLQKYNVVYKFNKTTETSGAWQVQTVTENSTITTIAAAPTPDSLVCLVDNATIGNPGSKTVFVSPVTVSNVKFDSSSQTATATLVGKYSDDPIKADANFDSTPTGTFKGTFAFKSGHWTLVSVQ